MLSLYIYISHLIISGSVNRFLACNTFVNDLKNADSEKLIEAIYHTELKKQINNAGGQVVGIQTGNKTDGILTAEFSFDGKPKVLNLIIETKFAETFSSNLVRSKVLAQVIYYLKSIDNSGNELPNVAFVGDSDKCFVLHTNLLQGYLQNNYDWTIPPSKAGIMNVALVDSLCCNNDIQKECFVFPIDNNFLMCDVVDKIFKLVNNVKIEVRITERSISRVFDHFSIRVLKKNTDGSSKYSSREQVEFFMTLVLNSDDCFKHPKRRDTAIFKHKEVSVYEDAFDALLGYYSFNYNAEDKKSFTSICDRLLEDSDRRRKGDFYTPTIWADEAHKTISDNIGSNWKEDYMVWDCACGTLNLTRDYKFLDLYCSTLSDSDLKTGVKYNQEAQSKFQYDFLNDDVILFNELQQKLNKRHKLSEKDFFGSELWYKAPSLISGMLNGKKLIFFINPPYGTATNRNETSKKDISLTEMNKLMLSEDIGACSQQLFAQFLYRIFKLKKLFSVDISIGIYAKSTYLTSSSFKKFRAVFLNNFTHINGMMFQASQFADVSGAWGIDFALWVLNSNNLKQDVFNYTLKSSSTEGIKTYAQKKLYNLDYKPSLSEWLKIKSKGEDAPQFTNALKWNKTIGRGRLVKDALGYLVFGGNNVYQNNQMVTLLSSCYNTGNGVSVLPENFDRCVQGVAARRLVTSKYANWVNDKDEYMIPDINNKSYAQWSDDCIVYSLFGTGSTQSSLRHIDYNNKKWDILNHFFFMSINAIKQLSLGDTPNDDIYADVRNHAEDERFVYTKLEQVTLSKDAQEVLDKARELIISSFKYRNFFNQEHPEYYINTWDAGWYQIKGMLKEYMPDELKDFNILYKQFEDRMRPLVYELGFLYK